MAMHLLLLDPDSKTTLQRQICEQLGQAIIKGHIPEDVPLPSSRKLSELLGISRNTVILAYEQLASDNYIVSRQRSGYYVNPKITEWNFLEAKEPEASPCKVDWQTRLYSTPSKQRNIVKPLDWQKYKYPFIYGQFDAEGFPLAKWRECVKDSSSSSSLKVWAPDIHGEDDSLLLNYLHTHILPRRGVWADPDEIMITLGAQNAIYMVTSLALNNDSVFGVENPGYIDAANIAETNGATIKTLAIDDGGLILSDELKDCDCVYVTPGHQFPTTVTLSIERRKKLLAMANEYDFIIIEDDYESEYNFQSRPIPSLKSMDECDRVIYVGSFSKILAPGLRLGYVVASRDMIVELKAMRRLISRNTPRNNQRSAALFLERGYYDAHVKKQRDLYEGRWKTMEYALRRYMPGSSVPPTFGGTSYWVKGPDNLNCQRLFEQAKKQDVLIEPGDMFFLDDSPKHNYFRLGYSSIAEDKIESGIKILAEIINNSVSY
ncbi:PLP-dependent aminotransferase family protein [Dasania marina]|uniref:MocR-like pyridoxine biosynthesis transcription factor PdxR n=1 Tax=Dasania marina TaxID=471499 RepID=UPI0030D6E186|tara:strand:+ start:58013 stop:59482 length:1470 start_codon:yes stop_codon:yes gene_type:complete